MKIHALFALGMIVLAAAPAAAEESGGKLPVEKVVGKGKPNIQPLPEAQNVKDVYQVGGQRDPFIPLTGGAAARPVAAASSFSEKDGPVTINIHEAELKALMGTGKKLMALIHDPVSHTTYILKRGRLYDRKDKRVPGISGAIQGKSVLLMTKDKDVQWLKLEKKDGGSL